MQLMTCLRSDGTLSLISSPVSRLPSPVSSSPRLPVSRFLIFRCLSPRLPFCLIPSPFLNLSGPLFLLCTDCALFRPWSSSLYPRVTPILPFPSLSLSLCVGYRQERPARPLCPRLTPFPPFSRQERKKKGEFNEQTFLGDILSYRGEFREAAECYQKGGKSSLALQMYTDLRMFDLAQVSQTRGGGQRPG